MACPVDGTALVMSERSGIEIDYCPSCRGVWLDRGELDKIIERNASQPQHSGSQEHAYRGQKPHKRRKSFLDELFD
ncbi:MAG TPA: zf-TFIIB domain-containing protein [Sphingomicrobium sp.]|nr:zf-TFIIB domain-containing protein [Sphingomicrobium sp.]